MINIPSTIKISVRALRVNKMRSALTMLGIIIGVGAVITMLAVGTGARQKIGEQIASMGSNLLIVLPGATTSGGARMGAGSQMTPFDGGRGSNFKGMPCCANRCPESRRSGPGYLRQPELVNRRHWNDPGNACGKGLADFRRTVFYRR